ncbi:MAG: ABC transporter permease DevC [Gemmataceae bacterium]|nr:ABC transporter permease DevC [Gemmataceae bacterium]
MKIPLAWRNLIDNKARFLTSVGGVAFAVVLMFVEMGFSNGLYDSETYFIRVLNADLIMINKFKEALVPKLSFPKNRLVQARAVPGVETTYALYVEEYRAFWKNSSDHKEHPILIFAYDPDEPVLLIPGVAEQAAKLKVLDTALIDSQSRDFFGVLTPGATAELNRHAIRIVGTYALGPDFRVDGDIIISDRTFFKSVADPRAGGTEGSLVEFGLIRITPGYDVAEVRAQLERALPDDVLVLTKAELTDRVKTYWADTKPVGYVFGLGTFVGFIIGVTICYQILFSDIVDHLPQYATLKAVGYGNNYLVKIVLQEAVYLGVIGFFPGMLVSLGLYALLQHLSGILMQLTVGRAVMVFVLTVVMCAVSGTIAIRKVINSDPAEVF